MVMMIRRRRLFTSIKHLSWKYKLLIYLRFGVCLYYIHLIIQGFSQSLRLYSTSNFEFIISPALFGLLWAIGESHLEMCYRQDAPMGIKFFCLSMLKSPDLGSVRVFALLQKNNEDFWDWGSGLLFGAALFHVIRVVKGSQAMVMVVRSHGLSLLSGLLLTFALRI